jgi:hypothetical protein
MSIDHPPGRPPPARTAPDPLLIRESTLVDVAELGFPPPPDGYPLVWDAGDRVALRPTAEIEARAAVLNTVLAATFGAPPELTAGWLEANGLRGAVTRPEWLFLTEEQGPADLFGLHIEAVWALAWMLGVAEELDPSQYCGEGLATWLPNLAAGESFIAWQARSASEPRPAAEAAALLDLYYCLDWGHVQALMDGVPPPGTTQPYVVGQRRWALEWSVVFDGPYHEQPLPWDEVDLAS